MSELHIQKFLRSGKTLKDLYQRYDVQYNLNSELGIVVFNYRHLSPQNSPIVKESRALILELDTWNVVCKSLDAFYEPSNPHAADVLKAFDWSTAKAMEKCDGALVSIYHYKGEWRCGTRFSPDGALTVWSINSKPTNLTWRQLTERVVQDMGYTWQEFTSGLDKDVFYTFELVAPENRVIVLYETRKLVLVGAIKRDTLEEIDVYSLSYPPLKPVFYEVSNMADCEALVEKFSEPYDSEGFVVIDKNFNRLKIRNPKHSEMLRTYSIKDEASALREIRMMDVQGLTVSTEFSVTTDVTDVDMGLDGESLSTQSVLNRMLLLAKYMTDAHVEGENDVVSAKSVSAGEIWPEALEALKNGMSMSDILDHSSEDEVLAALRRFEERMK